ncbi:uncharacterized protein METZ01_LOCUS171926, partial [marine metagenome]
ECYFQMTLAEAVAEGCAESTIRPKSASSEAEVTASSLLESYSWDVQRAFSRVSDMNLYDEEQLSGTADWVVVTGMPPEAHAYSSAGPDHSEPAPLLDGAYIWRFDDPSLALDSLEHAVKTGYIKIFYPLVELQTQLQFTPNDTLFSDQWHLDNTGQSSGTSGEDANITGVWDNYNGSGVVISIVDDGVQTGHPDLSANWNAAVSYDWCDGDTDPNPQSSSENHGTAVAGVAAATGDNNLDVSGAAFGATLSGQRLISCSVTDSILAGVLSFNNDIIDIYQNSWNYIDQLYPSVGPLTTAALSLAEQNGRGGLGNIIVFSAGNGLLGGSNSNYKDLPNSRYTIAVSAIDHTGVQSYYSEPGANILVAAHSSGGNKGSEFPYTTYVGITTTDRTGSDGYSSGDTDNNFGGTSSAAPLVSGIIALMLEANENLTWRDVQHILVNSARKNDPSDSSWGANGAGHDVSHKYGFGVIDAGAAVALAENWASVDDEANASYGPYTPSVAIPDASSSWTEVSTYVSAGVQVETTEVTVDIDHTYRGDLDIVLVSPSGTESWLAEGGRSDSGDDFDDWTFSTVHNWGEQSAGTWTLKVRDMAFGDFGTLNSWTLNTYGTSNPLYVTGAFEYEDREFDETGFTGVNPYLPIRGADVEIFDDSTGTILATTRTNNLGVFNASITITAA